MKNISLIKKIIIFVISALIIFFIFKYKATRNIINLLLISFIITYPLKPLKNLMVKNGFNNRKASLLIILLFTIIIFLCFGLIIPKLISESENFADAFSDINNYFIVFSNKIKVLNNNALFKAMNIEIYNRGNTLMSSTVNKFIAGIFSIGEKFLSILIIPVIVYYFLCEDTMLNNRILLFIPYKKRNVCEKITGDIDKILVRYIISQLMLSVLISVVTFIILVAYKIRFALLLSLLNGIFNIIPYFGPVLGALPIIGVAFLKSPLTSLYITLWMYVLQFIEGNIISPKVTGDSVNMHPLYVIILLILGGEIGGLLGMILVVPIGVIIKVIYEDLNYYMF